MKKKWDYNRNVDLGPRINKALRQKDTRYMWAFYDQKAGKLLLRKGLHSSKKAVERRISNETECAFRVKVVPFW